MPEIDEGTKPSNLHDAMSHYRAALDSLLAPETDCSQTAVLSVLVTRDRVQHVMQTDAAVTAEQIHDLGVLDLKLKQQVPRIVVTVGQQALVNWREAVQPAADAWWWSLDTYAMAAMPKPHFLLFTPVWFCVAVSLAYMIEIMRRLLGNSTEAPTTVLQGLLGLIVTGTIAQVVRQWLDSGSVSAGAAKRLWSWKTRYAYAAILVFLAVVVYLSNERLAGYYNNRGAINQSRGLVANALQDYQRAIRLSPGLDLAHYNLATLYEDGRNFDKAIEEYNLALQGDNSEIKHAGYRRALSYSNLARLYIIHRKDPRSAYDLLRAVFAPGGGLKLDIAAPEPQKTDLEYALYRNFGWANLGLKLFGDAQDALQKAAQLRQDRPVAHYLLARALEAQTTGTKQEKRKRIEEAVEHYEEFIAYAYSGQEQIEADWLSLAQQRRQHLQGAGK